MQLLLPTLLGILFLASPSFAVDPPGAAVSLSTVSLDATKPRVHFIDIGPGLAMLIETPNDRKHIFIDGGKWSLDDLETYVAKFATRSTPIDVVMVTHADLDHYKGAQRILEDWNVSEFWYTGYQSDQLPGSWDTFVTFVDDEPNCTIYWPLEGYVEAGETEVLDNQGNTDPSDDIVVQYLNLDSDPPAFDPLSGRRFKESQRRNNASLVFKLIYKDVSFLITGDINGRDKKHTKEASDTEIDSEELELWVRHNLNAKYNLKATVLQAPHHGSNGSNSLHFLRAVDPDWVVIPAGHAYDHPAEGTLRRMEKADIAPTHILRTDDGDSTPETGTVKDARGDDSFVFETDGDSISRILRVRLP